MSEWEEINKGKKFISDLGQSVNITIANAPGLLGRYAVWLPTKDDKHQVVEVGGDVELLMKKYEIPQERVYKVAV